MTAALAPSRTADADGSPAGQPTADRSAAVRPIRLRPAPRREPPFDDERVDEVVPGPRDRCLPLTIVRPRAVVWAPASARPVDLPDPAAWAHRLLIGMIETAGGRRPLHQLAAFLSPSVHRGIGAQFDRSAQAGHPHWLHQASVRSIRASDPAPGIVELAVVLDADPRVHAVAMRVERWHGHWRCTRLHIG